MPQDPSVWTDAIGRNLNLANAAKTKEQFYEIPRGVLAGYLDDGADSRGHGGVKKHVFNLETCQIYAHGLAGDEHDIILS
jgi:hypothetical protein